MTNYYSYPVGFDDDDDGLDKLSLSQPSHHRDVSPMAEDSESDFLERGSATQLLWHVSFEEIHTTAHVKLSGSVSADISDLLVFHPIGTVTNIVTPGTTFAGAESISRYDKADDASAETGTGHRYRSH